MPDKGYLDAEGLSVLWERIKRLVYQCAGQGSGGGGVRYWLESNGNEVSLHGSDGSVSTVVVDPVPVCSPE